jgi:hypothetical protein
MYHAKSNDTAQMQPIGLTLDWDENVIRFRQTPIVDETPVEEEEGPRSIRAVILELVADGATINKADIARYLGRENDETTKEAIRKAVWRLDRAKRITVDDLGNIREGGTIKVFQTLLGGRGDDVP